MHCVHVDSPLFAGTELGRGNEGSRAKKDQGVIQVGASLVGMKSRSAVKPNGKNGDRQDEDMIKTQTGVEA